MRSILGALIFYTICPLPQHWQLEFTRIARWSPLIGLLIGGLLGLGDLGLASLGVPILTRSALVVGIWLLLTGGLHLDGAIDTADGLAVLDPQRRLQVMSDSVTGAFGVMAAIVILLLKTSALYDLSSSTYRFLGLIMAAGWGRWAQVRAIAHYPYLKETGKGAFHKQAMHLPQDLLLGLTLLLGCSGFWLWLDLTKWWLPLTGTIVGSISAILVGAWFNHQLGGHTGDTYGATVEWTETIILCLLTILL